MKYAIKIEEFGIIIDLYEETSVGASHSFPIKYEDGKIQSTMHKEKMPDIRGLPHLSQKVFNDESTSRAYHDAIIDATEAMILAHAMAGIDVTEEKYVKGIRAAVAVAEKEYGS